MSNIFMVLFTTMRNSTAIPNTMQPVFCCFGWMLFAMRPHVCRTGSSPGQSQTPCRWSWYPQRPGFSGYILCIIHNTWNPGGLVLWPMWVRVGLESGGHLNRVWPGRRPVRGSGGAVQRITFHSQSNLQGDLFAV